MIDLLASKNVYFFSPHPDDIAISCGAICYVNNLNYDGKAKLVSVTTGFEAYLPDEVFQFYKYQIPKSSVLKAKLRGEIRILELKNEAEVLKFRKKNVISLTNQSWHSNHCTPNLDRYEDGSIKNINNYSPGVIEENSFKEIVEIFKKDNCVDSVVFIPFINDRLMMHEITSLLVLCSIAKLNSRFTPLIIMYRCLSSKIERAGKFEKRYFGFNESTMCIKKEAINQHQSMKIRRAITGGYTNKGSVFYDELIESENSSYARINLIQDKYCEDYFFIKDITTLYGILESKISELPLGVADSFGSYLKIK